MRKLLLSNVLAGILGLTLVNAQAVDSLDEVGKYEPLALHVGVSVNNIIRTVLRPDDTNYSFQADVVLGRYLMVAEYGWAELSRASDLESIDIAENPFQYSSRGSFFRIGPDVNLLTNQAKTSFRADEDIIFFGLRFARAQLSHDLTFVTRDDITDTNGNNNAFWPQQQLMAQNNSQAAIWFEMTAGMKVQLYRNIFLGYNLRFKFARNFLGGDPSLVPYEIPGYGFGSQDEQFRFDYYLFYRIPIKR